MLLFALVCLTLSPSGARAGDAWPLSRGPELRFGLAAHDPGSREQGTVDARAEIILPSFVQSPMLPRLALGGSLNLAGRTSHAFAGGLWRLNVTPKVFAELGLGAALHNGATVQSAQRSAMGCAFAFRESLGLGYRIDRNWSVVAAAEHLSNAGLCRRNRGVTNLGLNIGYSF
jgi:hypothetical protein